MRALVGLVVGLAVAVAPFATQPAQAGTRSTAKSHRTTKRHATETKRTKQRAARLRAVREHERERERIEARGPAVGQSVGAPWAGRLQHATQLPAGDGYFLRRPARAFGTEATVELTLRAIAEAFEAFPDAHVLAIGDISAPSGGRITEHHSHQSGRDIDVGLFYLDRPDGYPGSFVHADPDNLDCAATFKLLESFLATAGDDGGVQMIFLDFDVQGILYDWARDQGISERRLERIFQYPHGRDSYAGLVRHEPNHDNHMHVRFQCPADDSACH